MEANVTLVDAIINETTGGGGGTATEDNYYESLEAFKYYTEGVLLTPVSIFGVMGKHYNILVEGTRR
jgi:hypothetical protein